MKIEKPLCIIPARGNSKRFPRKNLALLKGKPLLAYAIAAGLESGIFDKVLVSSEDDEILTAAKNYGAEIDKRPEELAEDKIQIKTVCKYILESYVKSGNFYKEFAILLTTNPLRTVEDVRAGYQTFIQSGANYLLSLVRYIHPPQRAVRIRDGYIEPFLGIEYMKQTQLIEPLYRHDGSMIFAKTDAFLREGEYYGSKAIPYIIPPERSVDIDEPLDFEWAEFLLTKR